LLSYTQQQQPFHPHLPHKSNPSVTAQNRILQLRKNTQINNWIRQLPGCCFFFSFLFPIVWVGLQISKLPTQLQTKYKNVYYINYSLVVYQTQFAQLIPPQTVLKTQIARRVQEDLYRNCRLPNPLYTMTTNISTAEQREWRTHSYVSFFFSFTVMPFAFLHQLPRVFFFFQMVLLNMTKMLRSPTSQEILTTITKCFKLFSVFKQHSWMPKWSPEIPTDHKPCTSKLYTFIVCVYYDALPCSICLLLLTVFFFPTKEPL